MSELCRGLVELAATQSTCQKRVTVVALFDVGGELLSVGTNRCNPPAGICERLGVANAKADYPVASCNWVHAEVMALGSLPLSAIPFEAVLYGHDFFCDECEKALRARGVEVLRVSGEAIPGVGLREKAGTGSGTQRGA